MDFGAFFYVFHGIFISRLIIFLSFNEALVGHDKLFFFFLFMNEL